MVGTRRSQAKLPPINLGESQEAYTTRLCEIAANGKVTTVCEQSTIDAASVGESQKKNPSESSPIVTTMTPTISTTIAAGTSEEVTTDKSTPPTIDTTIGPTIGPTIDQCADQAKKQKRKKAKKKVIKKKATTKKRPTTIVTTIAATMGPTINPTIDEGITSSKNKGSAGGNESKKIQLPFGTIPSQQRERCMGKLKEAKADGWYNFCPCPVPECDSIKMSLFVKKAHDQGIEFQFVKNDQGAIDFSSNCFNALNLEQSSSKVSDLRRSLKNHFIKALAPGAKLRKEHKIHCPGVLLDRVRENGDSREYHNLKKLLNSIED